MGILQRSEPRDGYAVRVLAVHTSEGYDKPVVDDAAALRDAAWWEGSSHAIADNDPGSLLTPTQGCVPYDRASWTLRSGNRWSENIELIAQAGWTRAQWLARPTLLDRCAYWLAVRSKVDRGGGRRIPLVKITAAQYRAGAWGVIGHHDHTVGYSDGTHWDPGPNFPWDVVLSKAKAYAAGQDPEDDMALFTNLTEFKQAVYEATWGFKWTVPGTTEKKKVGEMLMDSVVNARAARVDAAVARKLAEESATRGTALSDADVQRIAEQTAAEVAEDLSEGYDLTATPKGDTDPA